MSYGCFKVFSLYSGWGSRTPPCLRGSQSSKLMKNPKFYPSTKCFQLLFKLINGQSDLYIDLRYTVRVKEQISIFFFQWNSQVLIRILSDEILPDFLSFICREGSGNCEGKAEGILFTRDPAICLQGEKCSENRQPLHVATRWFFVEPQFHHYHIQSPKLFPKRRAHLFKSTLL